MVVAVLLLRFRMGRVVARAHEREEGGCCCCRFVVVRVWSLFVGFAQGQNKQ
jgi:hypothetical protein